MYFEIKRYVHGLHEAPHEFNKTLVDIGFKRNQADPRAYMKQEDEGYIRLLVHDVDILMTCPHQLFFVEKSTYGLQQRKQSIQDSK